MFREGLAIRRTTLDLPTPNPRNETQAGGERTRLVKDPACLARPSAAKSQLPRGSHLPPRSIGPGSQDRVEAPAQTHPRFSFPLQSPRRASSPPPSAGQSTRVRPSKRGSSLSTAATYGEKLSRKANKNRNKTSACMHGSKGTKAGRSEAINTPSVCPTET